MCAAVREPIGKQAVSCGGHRYRSGDDVHGLHLQQLLLEVAWVCVLRPGYQLRPRAAVRHRDDAAERGSDGQRRWAYRQLRQRHLYDFPASGPCTLRRLWVEPSCRAAVNRR